MNKLNKFFKKSLRKNRPALLLLLLYLALCWIAKLFPEETAVVFFATVYPEYISWCFYTIWVSDQFRRKKWWL